MGTQIEVRQDTKPVAYSESAKRYAVNSKAANTKRAYTMAFEQFCEYCVSRGLQAIPAEVDAVINYLAHLADGDKKLSTIKTARAAISFAHDAANAPNPTKHADVKMVMSGIARTIGARQTKKDAVSWDELKAMVDTLDTTTLTGKRDKAILLIGWCGAFRRSELMSMRIEDTKINGGLTYYSPKSKTDQTGEQSQQKHIVPLQDTEYCPVTAYREYIDAAGVNSGFVFRRVNRNQQALDRPLANQHVAHLVKQTAKAAGLDYRSLSAHSLRAGFITSASEAGIADSDIMAQTWHKLHETVDGYKRNQDKAAARAMRGACGELD